MENQIVYIDKNDFANMNDFINQIKSDVEKYPLWVVFSVNYKLAKYKGLKITESEMFLYDEELNYATHYIKYLDYLKYKIPTEQCELDNLILEKDDLETELGNMKGRICFAEQELEKLKNDYIKYSK